MVAVTPMTIAEAVGHAQNSGDVQALAAIVLTHPGSQKMPRSAVLACARVAFSRHPEREDAADLQLVRNLAVTVLETELAA